MKTLHRLSLSIIFALVALPLAIMAQDDPPPIDLPLARTATLELYEYPTAITATVTPKPPTPKPPVDIQTTAITNGLWILDPKSSGYSSTGSCVADYGDNGGPDNDYQSEDELPTVPVCMSNDRQWLTVDAGGAYPLTIPQMYSLSEMERELLYTSGQTSGSVNVTITRQYRVINAGEIEYSYTRQETGGCTTQNTFRYKLKEANDLVCTGVVLTPEMTLTPIPPTAQPGETQQPPTTPEPPINTGRYIVTLPPTDDYCTEDTLPADDKLDLGYDNNQNLFINFGGGSYTLYWNGRDYYSYQDGNQFNLSMVTYDGGASFAWSKEGCFVSSELRLEGAPTPTPVPVEPTSEANVDVSALVGTQYTTTFDAPEMLCAAENKDILPDLSGATLTPQADNSLVFSLDGQDYVLTNQDGYYVYTQIGEDGSLIAIAMNGFYEGKGSGSYSSYQADGKTCTALLTFMPV